MAPNASASYCYDPRNIVTILMKEDNDGKEYKIFRELLMWHSSYFAAAFDHDGGFANLNEEALEMEYSHELFYAFYCWLYTGRPKDPTDEPINPNDIYLDLVLLCEVWIFADCRGIPELGNRAIDTLHKRCVATWQAPCSTIKYVYEITREELRLRA
jgi:hypothetical protein